MIFATETSTTSMTLVNDDDCINQEDIDNADVIAMNQHPGALLY